MSRRPPRKTIPPKSAKRTGERYRVVVPEFENRKLRSEITSDTDYLTNIRRRTIPFSDRFKDWLAISWINQALVTGVILVILWIIFTLIGLYN